MPSTKREAITIGVGLGSNVGDSPAHIAAALHALCERDVMAVTAVSPLYRTAPWGPVAQDDYANACAIGVTELAPLALLDAVKRIEVDLGRVETVRWGPRVIDIDILFYGEEAYADARLILPHKDLFQRAFVLRPLADIAADRVIGGRRVGDAARERGDEGVRPWKAGR
jgi:2-amino-4-hydroxy-6-hydroxymethyldihydropteridine diphosphokinase